MLRRLARQDPLAKDPIVLILYLSIFFFVILFTFYPLIQGFIPTVTRGLEYYEKFLTERLYKDAVINTFLIAAISTPSATLLGLIYAYALTRMRIPFKKLYTYTVIIQLIAPPFATGLAFIMIFGRNGVISRFLEFTLGYSLDIYGTVGLWIVETLTFFPIAFLVFVGAVKALDPTYEYAAKVLGASGIRSFFDVNLRLLYPSLLAAIILVAMNVFSDFGNPLLVGGNFYVLATLAYTHVVGWGDYVGAAATAYVLLAPVIILFFIQWKILGRGLYVTVTGRETIVELREPSKYVKIPVIALMTLVSGIIITLYASILLGAITRTWGVDYTFTLKHFEDISLAAVNTLRSSLTVAIFSAILCATIGFFAAYLVTHRKILLNKFTEVLVSVTNAIPGTLIGIAYILAFARYPFALTGSALIIVLNNVVRFLPLAFQSGKAVLTQVDSTIEETSITLGDNVLGSLRRVLLPLAGAGFASGLVYSFIKSMNTVSAVIFLQTPDTRLMAPFILGLGTHGYWGQAAALSSLLIGIVIGSLIIIKLTVGRKIKIFGELL